MAGGQYYNISIIEGRLYFGVDINGSTRPNRLGHDIFVFVVDKKNDSLSYYSVPQKIKEEDLPTEGSEYLRERAGYPCNLTSNQKANGIGSAYYVLKNKCPDGSTREYFDCLPK